LCFFVFAFMPAALPVLGLLVRLHVIRGICCWPFASCCKSSGAQRY
jgi:hypothetical protein